MPTFADDPVISRNHTNHPDFEGGVYGESSLFNGVRGVTSAVFHGAVVGVQENDTDQAGPGVFGQSKGTGVWGESRTWMGVYGKSDSTTGGAGVMGEAQGAGVIGKSATWHGVYGETPSTTGGAGVWGEAKGPGAGVVGKGGSGVGVWAVSDTYEAVHAETHSPVTAAIAAYNLAPDGTGAAVFAKKEGSVGHAGFFDGDVFVSRTLTVQTDIVMLAQDFAEDFDTAPAAEAAPGTVMVLGDDGALRPSEHAYDRRVAGVISGAGDYRPGLILDKRPSAGDRVPVALVGKVYCKVDADYAPIEIGDLLTTSPTRGHAMKAVDQSTSFGAVIGKALQRLAGGRGLLPILVALQ